MNNAYVKKFKELLENRRTRAAVILFLWFLFFLFIFAAFDVRKPQKESYVSSTLEDWKGKTTYEYQMTLSIDDKEYKINGHKYVSREEFVLEDTVYYLENNLLYRLENGNRVPEENTVLLGLDFTKLSPTQLEEIISKGSLQYTTNYEDGLVKKGYEIPLSDVISWYRNLTVSDSNTMAIELSEKNKQIVEVNIDFTHVIQYSQPSIKNYQIKINYVGEIE